MVSSGTRALVGRGGPQILPGWTKAIGWRELLRTKRGVDSLEKVHPHERHYYLPFVGVTPEVQGAIARRSPRTWRQLAPAAGGATSVPVSRCARKSASRATGRRSGQCGRPRRPSVPKPRWGAPLPLLGETAAPRGSRMAACDPSGLRSSCRRLRRRQPRFRTRL
jgi:hypothetical protein